MRDLLDELLRGHADRRDPVRAAREAMKTSLPKRFYKTVTVARAAEGFTVELDSKPVRTPGRALLLLPGEAAARLVADEFAAQKDVLDPLAMPVWRLVNTAIDGVASDPQAVIEDIMRYAASDLICYRAEGPERLIERQAELWDPWIDWARVRFSARFILAEGVMHVEQPRETIAAVGLHLRQRDEPLRLAAIHVMTTLTGSALLALAVENGALSPEDAWTAAHVDEDWNIAQWGEDAEAAAIRSRRKEEMLAAAALLRALE
jgi:chaperone required for assembly of F1-ATPase